MRKANLLITGALVGALVVLPIPTAEAQATGCTASIAGTPVERIKDWPDALVVNADSTIVIRGQSQTPVTFLSIDLDFAGLRWGFRPEATAQVGARWAAQLDVAAQASQGVGLYHVVASTDGCTAEGWIRVVGRSPFTTVAGLIATGILALGLAMQVAGLFAARRGKGLALSIVGGIPTGIGALVLSQEFGILPISPGWLSVWAVGPGVLGGVARAGVAALRRPSAPAEPAREEEDAALESGPPEPVAAEAPASRRPTERIMSRAGPPAGPVPTERAMSRVEPPAGGVTVGGPQRDPPRSAYALLRCPGVVVAEEEFDLTVGLSEAPTSGVTGGPIVRPPSSVGPYTLAVQVVADGFRLAGESGSWRHDLPVTADAPYPSFVLRLAAEHQAEPVKARTIQAMYSVDGQTIGMAVRAVAVVRTKDLAVKEAERPPEEGVDISIPSERTAPDLTVRILHGQSEGAGRLLWTFESPHPIPSLDAPVVADIGRHPEGFAKLLVEQVAVHEGQPGLYQYLTGVGNTVADNVPQQFWDALSAVARLIGSRPPSVLFLSEEPYVPWELAVMDPPLDESLPPFLSAQASVGRWVLGHRRPKLPPPNDVQVHALAVVWGVYDRQEWRLLEAEDEAARLRQTFGAASVDAQAKVVIDCLKGDPRAEILHFAVHGWYNPTSPKEGLILVDGQTLDPMEVRGVQLQTAPFVFLNACQVGTGAAILGDYAGMAEAFLYAGAAGVVAPLWSIDDALAKEIALRFYQQTLVEGRLPAEVFRTERARFTDAPQIASSTFLAYQFFGNPAMKLSRSDGGGSNA